MSSPIQHVRELAEAAIYRDIEEAARDGKHRVDFFFDQYPDYALKRLELEGYAIKKPKSWTEKRNWFYTMFIGEDARWSMGSINW